ncbi:MAG TPA: hypothetical protein VHM25_07215 [Polyangiaceae bacterium]|nr:hypothetical protein [Polyangiaceae bacterium]
MHTRLGRAILDAMDGALGEMPNGWLVHPLQRVGGAPPQEDPCSR